MREKCSLSKSRGYLLQVLPVLVPDCNRLRSLELHIGDLDPGNPESMNGGQEDNTFAVGVVDHDWGRDEVHSTPTPAPSAVLF